MRNLLYSWPSLILTMSLMSLSSEVSGQCLSDQQSLLLELKESVLSYAPKSKKLMQWNQSSDCCFWDGITCDEKGRVTGLNLSSEWISRRIDDSSLFNLKYLSDLDLSFNNFSSEIPARIGNLTNLKYLSLSNAGFGGQIPQQISQLFKLVSLDFSTLPFLEISSLKLENPNLSMLVQKLSSLEELYLDGVNISARGSEWCEPLASSLPNLRVLSLSNCFLSGPIDQSLGKLQSLSAIHLDNNNLSSPIPGFITSFSNLTSLRLSSCGLYGTFPREIFQVPTLQIIDLSNNQLLHGSLPEFPGNSALQRVELSSTNFSGRLPLSIGNVTNLSLLHLSNCQFNETLPSSMEQLSQIVNVDLSNNKFIGPVPFFKMSKNLTRRVLSHNSLSGEITSGHWEGLAKLVVVDLGDNLLNGSIPSSLFALPSLEMVRLSYNQFVGQLPEFTNASSSLLDTLDLNSNNLEGPIPLGNDPTWSAFSTEISTLNLASCRLGIFPNLKNQAKLVSLDLSDNQIQGEVPNWVWELGNGFLLHLNLSHNSLTSLQEPYSVPYSLNVLDLHANDLHGEIPILPPYAGYIGLSSNAFTTIPADFGKYLPFAYFISLSNNSLAGVIPESLCNASYIQVLDFSDNNLRGAIPICMSVMSETLGVLNLRRNNLTGRIPDAFPKISSLRVVVLRSNKFHGPIGCLNTIGTWTKLQIIDLAHNNFDGELPGEGMRKWEGMAVVGDDDNSELNHIRFQFLEFSPLYYKDSITVTLKGLELKLQKILHVFTSIDLSCNKFVGAIPEELGLLQALYSLNLSYNALTGKIPSSVGNLRQLESLDLSSNYLNGTIPLSLATLNFLSFLDLCSNQLVGMIPTGMIPTGTQIQTFPADHFEGNEGLCGPPLVVSCSSSSSEPTNFVAKAASGIDWNMIAAKIGFIVGFGSIIGPLLFLQRFRRWYYQCIDDITFRPSPRNAKGFGSCREMCLHELKRYLPLII
ncbi:receptor-like protein 12 [Morus notabilis]|uniref:receptor-like protein 12 n=1 Tax=Morus notabilis TaxID=981085 RepID=UPI000CED4467|nr:receptor-like protein 12 [Morus notabilis]